ncbi:putative Inositol-tetrakisphosphate 1-kinase [Melia azedarach]|uniref:Inositol-tetrakisphosphate 1-kinase n=1 Tax=Melia azedarach TaxID=155640 RepID=A0ACC1YJG2_MELAZ|nr:putative Inositol-tetrakisphosphate 1-kinase [Melia azedarach]
MSLVRGVILDESVLLSASEHQTESASDLSFQLLPGASYLLRKLRHSDIRKGISYAPSVSAYKVSVLKRIAAEYLCDCFLLDASIDGGVNEITQVWGDVGGSIMCVVSNNKGSFRKLSGNWLITVVGVEGASADQNSNLHYVNKLEELPLTICDLNKKATGNKALIVAYVMKPSREEDFAKRGAFPMCPTPNGLIFMPLTFEIPLSSQLQKGDVVLHKATDEIISIELGSATESSNRITYTLGMQELQRFMEHHSDFFTIDPLNNVYPVMDRLKIQLLLLGLQDPKAQGRQTIRGPHFLKVNNFNDTDLAQGLSEAKLSLPCIVKPQVACGVADSHSMAIVFRLEDFKNLSVPLPAIVQEYVNHSSTLFKFYVLGENVFHAVKKSTPNSVILMKSYERNGLKPITFDSLKSLPIDTENQHSGKVDDDLDLGLVKDAAIWLAKTLDLTIFGFDIVIQEGTGDHVIVDVNYLPSFKEVNNDIAIPAFWDAIKTKYESKKMNRAITAPS